jgi:steroid delta-isomerase-like uncharacterized protein
MERHQLLDQATGLIDAWNRGDADDVAAHFGPSSVYRDVARSAPARGPEEVRAVAGALITAFPDLHLDVHRVLVEGDRVVQEWTAKGTNDGELVGVMATELPVEVDGCNVTTFADDGRVRETTVYWDVAGLMRQLGPAIALTPA